MNKQGLMRKMADKLGVTLKDAEAIIEAFKDSVQEGIKEEGKVQLIGFLSFEVVDVDAREYRNPKTGEKVLAEAKKKVKVKAGKEIKDLVK